MESPDEPQPRFLLTVRKWDVVDVLRREHALKTMVQILTPSTGPDMHGRPELERFSAVTTLTYAVDAHRREIEHAKLLPTFEEVAAWCKEHKPRADLVFVDCWHTYDESVRALDLALSMLPRGGFIVMHDCDPPDADAAGPPKESCMTLWCGESWRAFVDVTAGLPGCEWFVVESDLGVGVITVPRPNRRTRKAQLRRKQQAPPGYDAAWKWLVEHRTELLHPVSIAEWQQRASRSSEPIH